MVIAIIGILAALLLPALNHGKLKAQGLYCLNNHRQLCLAWRMYVEDNADRLPYASEDVYHPETEAFAWITGTLDFNPDRQSNWDPSLTIMKSPLWPYCGKSTSIWRCPADRSFVEVNGEEKPRVRSMSMNLYLGAWGLTDGNWGGSVSNNFVYRKFSELVNPGYSTVFVFLDMRSDSIDMGNFGTRMAGWPDRPAEYGFIDLPGFYHDRAAGFSFADGHSEMKRWQDSRTMPPMAPNWYVGDMFDSPGNPDVAWLQDHATRPR